MSRRTLLSAIATTFVALLGWSQPASANFVNGGTVTADCKGYAVTVNAVSLTANTTYSSDYSVTLSCTGAPTSSTVSGTRPITNNNDGTGNATGSGSWSPLQLSGTCSVAAAATLTQNPDTPVALTPQGTTSSFTCAAPPPPAIKLIKRTNGVYTPGRNDGNAPLVSYPGSVSWTYEVTNIGTVLLSNVTVSDTKGVMVFCPKTTLNPAETMTCSASGPSVNVPADPASVAGTCPSTPPSNLLYENGASVSGTYTPPSGPPVVVTDSSVSHYCTPTTPSIKLKKLTNNVDTPSPTDGLAPQITAGQPVTWTYIVTNAGNLPISNVALFDNKIGSLACPFTSLAVGESQTCTKTGTAIAVYTSPDTAGVCGGTPGLPMYENTASVSGTASNGTVLNASYKSHYCNPPGPAYTLKKLTNGVDTPSRTDGKAPQVAAGSTVTWTYIVQNTGNVPLTNVAVSDDKEGFICTVSLAIGQSQTCTKSDQALTLTSGNSVPGTCGNVFVQPLYENKAMSTVTYGATQLDSSYLSHYCNGTTCSCVNSFNSAGTAAAGFVGLGSALKYGVLGLTNTQINNSNVFITGNVGVAQGGKLTNMAPSTVSGNVVEYASGQYSGPGKLGGSIIVSPATLNQNVADALAASSTAAALPVTQTFGAISSAKTIVGNGGLNVIKVNGNITDSVTLQGGPSDVFIVNVTGTVTFGGSSVLGLSGGVTANHVLYNFTGSSGTIKSHVGNTFYGTLLAPNYSFDLDGAFNGEIIGGGKSIVLKSGAKVNNPCTGCQ